MENLKAYLVILCLIITYNLFELVFLLHHGVWQLQWSKWNSSSLCLLVSEDANSIELIFKEQNHHCHKFCLIMADKNIGERQMIKSLPQATVLLSLLHWKSKSNMSERVEKITNGSSKRKYEIFLNIYYSTVIYHGWMGDLNCI